MGKNLAEFQLFSIDIKIQDATLDNAPRQPPGGASIAPTPMQRLDA
jgi:hypothetical protein